MEAGLPNRNILNGWLKWNTVPASTTLCRSCPRSFRNCRKLVSARESYSPWNPKVTNSSTFLRVLTQFVDEDHFEWSSAVSILNDSEQFVKVPKFGDVRVVVKVTTYTTLLTIESVSEVEINAIDIRGRLSRHELETVMGKNSQTENRHSIVIGHCFETEQSLISCCRISIWIIFQTLP